MPQSAAGEKANDHGGGQRLSGVPAHHAAYIFGHGSEIVLANIIGGRLNLVGGRMRRTGCCAGYLIAALVQCCRSARETAGRLLALYVHLFSGFFREFREVFLNLPCFFCSLLLHSCGRAGHRTAATGGRATLAGAAAVIILPFIIIVLVFHVCSPCLLCS